MTPAQAIAAKELRSAFSSPIVYVVAAVLFLIFGVLSWALVVNAGVVAIQRLQTQGLGASINLNDLVFRPIFYWMAFYVLPLAMPMLTMRVFAEERKLRTFELLMTSPVRINEIVAGKFAAVLAIYLTMLGLTGIVPLTLSAYNSFDWAPIGTGYLGLALLGALFLATGLFASSLTENQIVAAFVSFGIIFLIWLLGLTASLTGDTTAGNVIAYISYSEHYDRLIRGVIDTRDLVYYVCAIGFMLFLTHRIVESQRWK